MSNTNNVNKEYKIIFTGDSGVGKSTFIKRHLTGEFVKKYIPTTGVEVTQLVFDTNRGPVTLKLWDCADHKLREGFFIGAHAAVVMFDATCQTSYTHVDKHVSAIRKVCEDIPIVLCGNKVDIRNRVVYPKHITKQFKLNLTNYYDVSARSNYNFEKPFLRIIRKLLNDQDVMFEETNNIYKNMRFFVFPEFRNIHLLEKVREAFPGIQVPTYGLHEEKREHTDVVYTNAKLFFTPEDKHEVDRILDTLYEIGFDVVNERPYMDHTDRKTGRTTRGYMDDRVILSG